MSEFNEKMALAMIEELPIGDNAKKVLTDIVKPAGSRTKILSVGIE